MLFIPCGISGGSFAIASPPLFKQERLTLAAAVTSSHAALPKGHRPPGPSLLPALPTSGQDHGCRFGTPWPVRALPERSKDAHRACSFPAPAPPCPVSGGTAA